MLEAIEINKNLRVTVVAEDADTGRQRKLRVEPDQHGLVIGADGTDENIVIDLNKNQLSVYHSNDNGDVTGDAVLQLQLK
jgi:transcription antitermination factor NusA-like protein